MATPHAIVGALLALQFKDPAIGLPVAFLSHFLFDLVPHWDWGWHPGDTISRIKDPTKRNRIVLESTLDVIFGFVICFILFWGKVNPIYLFAMILAAQGPDWLSTPYHLFHWHLFPLKFISDLQHKMQLHAKLPWGITNQIAAVVAFALLIYILQNSTTVFAAMR